MIRLITIFALLSGVATSGQAFELSGNLIGRVSVFSNDYFGDGHDRWRSGSYFRSTYSGPPWQGDLSVNAPIMEFRLRGETISPTDLSVPPSVGERPYAGVAAIGLFAHVGKRNVGGRFGAELVAVGPQTGIANFVEWSHGVLGFPKPRGTSGQIGNALHPTATAELFQLLSQNGRRPFDMRPFAEAQVGAETYFRVGVDLIFGNKADGALLTRDPVTGQLLTVATVRRQQGLMPSIGADLAYVTSSVYLPSSSGLEVEPWRMRVRAGARYVVGRRDLFVGLTWLGPEYTSQGSGQVVGSLSFNYQF